MVILLTFGCGTRSGLDHLEGAGLLNAKYCRMALTL